MISRGDPQVPSFDEPDVQLKLGAMLKGRVVGHTPTNCCLMVSFDREITAATDTVQSGVLPLRDGKPPGLDKGTKACRARPHPALPLPAPRTRPARTRLARRVRRACTSRRCTCASVRSF